MFGGLLIGKSIRIIESTDKTLAGISGRIIDETKNTLILIRGESKMIIPKSIASFELLDERGLIVCIAGSELLGTPQERLSKI